MTTGQLEYQFAPGVQRIRQSGNSIWNKAMDALILSVEPRTLRRQLLENDMAHGGLGGMALELIEGLAFNFAIVGMSAVVGGTICGAMFSEVPLVGTAGGAEFGALLGASIANACLAGVGIITSVQMVGYVMGAASVPLQAATQLLLGSGSVQQCADQFAMAWCEIAMAIIPLVIMLVLHKGYGKLSGRIKAFTRLNAYVSKLPQSISNFASSAVAKRCGFGFHEFQSLKAMSFKRFILVRAGNMARTNFIGQLLEAKGIEVKGKTIREGEYSGCVALNDGDLAKLSGKYKMDNLPGGKVKLSLPEGKTPGDVNLGVLDKQLDGWTYEPVRVPGSSETRYLLRDPSGRVATGDIDRLAVMEFSPDGKAVGTQMSRTRLSNIGAAADDPAEISWWNSSFNKLTGRRRATRNTAMHGPSNTWVNEQGVSNWQADSNETLLLFSNGQAFEMTWNQMVEFMRANQAIGAPQAFLEVTQ
jgi:hypothetical protein